MKVLIALITGLLLCTAVNPSSAGDYRCNEEASTCLKKMADHIQRKGWVGIEIEPEEGGSGMVVQGVVPDSPAARFGFRVGDKLLSFKGISYLGDHRAELKKAYTESVPGDNVTYVVERQGERVEIRIELAAVPPTVAAAWIGQHMLDHHVEPAAGGAE
jgi:predicted metalloprotease with PDZ domain